MTKIILTNKMVDRLALITANNIDSALPRATKVYAIPRGGIPAALAVIRYSGCLNLTDDPSEADLFIDDIVDSGYTMKRWCEEYPGRPFFSLIDKTQKNSEYAGRWVVFPWEKTAEGGIEDNIRRLIQFVGEDPARGGLLETPQRVARAWRYWCSGYYREASDILKVFEDGAEKYDEMVIVKDIPIYSKCEHHLADIFGTATIAYVPNGKVVGLSKLSRLADMFARRLQVQERLTSQIADALEKHLQPEGVGVIIRARHLCMESRGICQQGHHTITSALRGVLKDKPEARAEFMELAK